MPPTLRVVVAMWAGGAIFDGPGDRVSLGGTLMYAGAILPALARFERSTGETESRTLSSRAKRSQTEGATPT